MKMTSLAALSALTLAAALTGGSSAHAATLQLSVDRDGLKWTSDCGATVLSADGDSEIATLANVNEAVDLPNGAYHAVVSCPSTEGTLVQTTPFKVKNRDVQLAITMRPSFVVASVTRNGNEVPAKLKVLDRYGRTVAKGKERELMVVTPGKYTLRGVVPKKASGQRRKVSAEMTFSIKAGKKETPVLDASDGELLLTLNAGGKNVEGTGTLMNKRNKPVAEVTAGEAGPVPPGTYTLVTQLYVSHDFAEVRTSNVTIGPGKTLKKRIVHPVGWVTPRVLLDKKPPPEGAKIDVQIFKGVAPKSFNAIALDEVATLSPGTYRFVAKYKKKRYSDRSKWMTEATVTIRKGQRKTAVLDLTPARLTINTQMGGEAKPLMVKVFRPEKEAPAFAKKSNADSAIELELPPGRFRIVTEMVAPQGTLQAEIATSLKRGQRTTRDLSIDVGSATVKVFDKKVSVPAEVMFFRPGAAAPAATVKAGQKVFLEPGAYALKTRRGGVEKTFSPIKVAAGRHVERELELTIGKAVVPPKKEAPKAATKKKPDPRKKKPKERTEVDDLLD